MKKSMIKLITVLFIMFFSINLYAKEKNVKVYYEKIKTGQYVFYADNKSYAPYTLELSFKELLNYIPSKKVPYKTVLLPKSTKQEMLTITAVPNKKAKFYYNFNYWRGDCINAKHDDSYIYQIPFTHGSKFKTSQAYDGGFTHIDKHLYAVDFSMPEGTKILAARGGMVIDVKEDSNIGGTDIKYAKHGNFVRINHNDGTIANYVHLRKNGAIVNPGDKVKTGQMIGYSGNTGRSGKPHLHFSVSIPQWKEKKQTIPTKFYNTDGKAMSIQPITWYYGYHPGRSVFDIIYGRDLKNEDFENKTKKISSTDKVKVWYKKTDNTAVFWVENGKNYDINLDVNFTLKNMVLSKENPVSIRIPALTKQYICLVRPREPKDSKDYKFKFKFSYRYNYKKVKQ